MSEKKIYPTDNEAKQMILEVGRRMYAKNYVAATDGNISCKAGEDVIWATPTAVSKGYMSQDILIKMRLDGEILIGGASTPTSEIKMHLRAYNENPDIMGVVHAHPPICTAFAIAGISLDKPIYPEAVVFLGSIPCVHYETPGTQGVPDSISPYCKEYNALLLGNHGTLSWGKSLMEAYYRLEMMENYAQILMYTSNIIGKANMLNNEEIAVLLEIRKRLGISGGGIPQ